MEAPNVWECNLLFKEKKYKNHYKGVVTFSAFTDDRKTHLDKNPTGMEKHLCE